MDAYLNLTVDQRLNTFAGRIVQEIVGQTFGAFRCLISMESSVLGPSSYVRSVARVPGQEFSREAPSISGVSSQGLNLLSPPSFLAWFIVPQAITL